MNQDELLKFLLDEAGGKEKVLLKFHRRQLAELACNDKTLGELFDVAKAEGWDDWLKGIKINDLANIVNPPTEAPTSKSTPGVEKVRQSRLLPRQKASFHDDIVAFLTEHPGSSAREMAEHFSWAPKKLAVHLVALRKEGRITSTGDRVNMTYAVPSEPPKAVPPIRRRK
jgi:hypothetical protein